MATQSLNVETKVTIDWHLLEAIETEATALGTNVGRIVNEAVAGWVQENIPGYYDAANHELRAAETSAVLEDRVPEYPDWFQCAALEERIEQLRPLVSRWTREASCGHPASS